jgi:nitrate reductase gamma subunit
MTSAELLVGILLPYVAVATFAVGIGYRFANWSRTPQPAKLTLYPTAGWGTGSAIKEALFFPNLFKGDRLLWIFAWSFHAALALALVGHLRVATGLVDAALGGLGMTPSGIGSLSTLAGGAAGIILLLAVGALLVRRLVVQRAREVSNVPDFIALLLLVAVILSGNAMRFGSSPVDLNETRDWALSLLLFSPAVPTNTAVLLHAFCAELLIIYLPLSKLMHFGGMFYTLSLVRRS